MSFLWYYLIKQVPHLQPSASSNSYLSTSQDIFVYLNSLDYSPEFQTINGQSINDLILKEAVNINSKSSKKQVLSYKVIERNQLQQLKSISEHQSNLNPSESHANPFLSDGRVISKQQEFNIHQKMTILAVLGPLPKSQIDFEMTSAEINHLSAETHRIFKGKSAARKIQKFLNLDVLSFKSENSNVVFYCIALRFILQEQMRAFLNLDHRFIQNFVVGAGRQNLFFQRMDFQGIGSILCLLKNAFIYRNENLDFARDLFRVVSSTMEQYWR